MARIKMYCIGKNRDGSACKNWAIKGSYYCSAHQGQVTEQDVQNMKTTQSMSIVIIILIIVVGFIISIAAGCEKQYLKWLSH